MTDMTNKTVVGSSKDEVRLPSKLRVIEPYRSKDGVKAEVYFSKLGGTGAVVIEADTGSGEEAEVVLSPQEVYDLALWLQCTLGNNPPPPETCDDLCVKCRTPLPALETWSGPACPACTDEAETVIFLTARLGTILNIAEGGLSDRCLPEIARLAREVVRPALKANVHCDGCGQDYVASLGHLCPAVNGNPQA